MDEVIYPSRPVLTIQVCWGSVMSGLPSVGQVYIQKCYVLKKKNQLNIPNDEVFPSG